MKFLLPIAVLFTALNVSASTLYYKTNDACTRDREGDVTLTISTEQVPFDAIKDIEVASATLTIIKDGKTTVLGPIALTAPIPLQAGEDVVATGYPNRTGIVVGKKSALLKTTLVRKNGHLLPLSQAVKEKFISELTLSNFYLNVDLQQCNDVSFKLMVP